MRTFGVEEELLLVDARGTASPVAPLVLADAPPVIDGPSVSAEIQQEMIETQTRPQLLTSELLLDIIAGRELADGLAQRHGARAIAVAMSPMRLRPHVTEDPRYATMIERYGLTARGTLVCGSHVHVGIESREEGVAVLDRIRTWLPTLLALSANSPFFGSADTGHASYRFVAWHQWQSAGPTDVFGSVEAYDRFERFLVDTGVILDTGMLYLDARVSRKHPTVEIRVADVCLDARDAAVIAAIVRALVDTAVTEWHAGVEPAAVPSAALRLAEWQAALTGVAGSLPHPVTWREASAVDAVQALVNHTAAALAANGDLAFVQRGIARIHATGGGAGRQRAAFERRGRIRDVVAHAVVATHEQSEDDDLVVA
ncbi:glutamate--cysteine ligase [Leifsonia shinshuensis]|uniref:glutamate--cysteine ligase n=1 Tax=Leifsonia shinshuensis TaxID=150026 RepID=UPI0028654A99|nr:glutamate--cysteine ligase [Leifsonia shinshuensis]MDR6973073.1 carboxylate-amine ligase [Leifsonia shinshuensis]